MEKKDKYCLRCNGVMPRIENGWIKFPDGHFEQASPIQMRIEEVCRECIIKEGKNHEHSIGCSLLCQGWEPPRRAKWNMIH